MSRLTLSLVVSVPLVGALFAAPKSAEPVPAKPSAPSLDEALLEGLDNELLDGADVDGKHPAAKEPKTPSPKASSTKTSEKPLDAADQKLLDELIDDLTQEGLDAPPAQVPGTDGRDPVTGGEDIGGEDVGSDENPLVGIGEKMRTAGGRIHRNDSGEQTRQLQDQIVSDLDELIDQVRRSQKRQQQQSASASSSPNRAGDKRDSPNPGSQANAGQTPGTSHQPVRDSDEGVRKNESKQVDLQALSREMMKDFWGNLPDRERHDMLQSPAEQFVPKYEDKLYKYFQRLAEERLAE